MKKYFPVYVRVPLVLALFFMAIEYFVDSGDSPAFIKYPIISVILLLFILLQIAFELIYEATNNILNELLTEEQRKQKEIEESQSFTEKAFYKNWMQKLTRTRSIEDEKELLLAHDYDGIKELDNVLPPWWVYLFYACILFGVVYLVKFEIMGAPNQEMELQNEMAQAKIEVAEYMKTAPDMMDEKSVILLTDATTLAEGKAIYTTNCVACHRADAGGQIGPNLTDDKWILGGGIKNLFHTITNGGRDDKGMIAWKGNLKPKEIQKVACYIISLKGSNPLEPKPPEGEVWVDTVAK
ncbi:cbb3-type cytochrome c oxidase N-terminal domain-containing protein [Flavobacterium sp.]|uniref:cbb3-type cytochrome c oxidase N-terminal domain-containing protein n=1 Tax=Flavobacterium sp. TaxID=239 RepID=UPI00374D1455